MGFLSNIFGYNKSGRPPDDNDFWYEKISGFSTSGVKIDEEQSIKIATVLACVKVISEAVATLPLIVYERLPGKRGKQRAEDHPLYDLLHRWPNSFQTAFDFIQVMTARAVLMGNSYAKVIPGRRGFVDQLIPVHPKFVTPEMKSNGKIFYHINENNRTNTYSQHEILHLRGLISEDNFVGISPIEHANNTFGLAKASETYGAKFFENDARPGGVLTTEQILNEDTRKALAQQWKRIHSGVNNAHRVAILGGGLKWQGISNSNADNQYLEVRNFQVNDIARIFGVPTYMLQHPDSTNSYSSSEQAMLYFKQHTLQPWLARWENTILKDLILNPKKFFVEFLVDGLLRSDIVSRYNAYSIGVQNGWLNVNEVRSKEGMNSIEGGDQYLQPLNMGKLGHENVKRRVDKTKEED